MINSLNDISSVNAYLRRIGAEARSLRSAVVKENHGAYWKDIAIIYISPDGKIKAPAGYEPTQLETAAIAAECLTVQWPTHKLLKKLHALPPEIEAASADDVFTFYDMEDNIIMLQLRREKKGEKSYIPYTFWSDGVWRCMEPEGKLPIWGLEQLKEHTTVFIHEGAKAARFVRRMVEGKTPADRAALEAHPWGDELKAAAHVGWIGGALSPYRTDWDVLMKAGVKRVYIVSDNDAPGVNAVPSISYHLRCTTFQIQFSSEWPGGFDLADEFPKTMFKVLEGNRYYTGPSFRACMHPATWATDQVPNPKGKPSVVLRQNFKEMWAYVEEADLFVCVEMPEIVRTEQIMNKILAPFSHTNQTSQLIVKAYTGRTARLCYRPDIKGRIVTDDTTSAINMHTPTHIKSKPGSAKPFLDFMEYMFPNPVERKEMKRWCATLIARTDVHIEYGILLVSEQQGIGKTTLGSSILAPLVGYQNVSFPSENQIVGNPFNGWLANKRLTVVNEIYSGHSWKAYHELKNVITENDITVNEKYQRPYKVDNWCHIFACSNSMRALKMEDHDRRWFYPEVTEEKWSRDQFVAFHGWLRSGGLNIIKHWAENQNDYVMRGQPAPMTEGKLELIRGSRTEAQQEVTDLAEMTNSLPEPIAYIMKDVMEWVKSTVGHKVYDSELEIRKAMKDAGMFAFEERIKVIGKMQFIMMNNAMLERLKSCETIVVDAKRTVKLRTDIRNDPELSPEAKAVVAARLREMLKSPAEVCEPAV